jgi:hypothetical protein
MSLNNISPDLKTCWKRKGVHLWRKLKKDLICYYYLRGLFNAYFICNKSQEGIILILSHQLTVYFLPFSHVVKTPTINRLTATSPFAKKILCHRPMNSTHTDLSFPQEAVSVSFLLLMLVTSNIQAALLRTYFRNVMCLKVIKSFDFAWTYLLCIMKSSLFYIKKI